MQPRIHHLSDHLISQIAAGEVVERPASVVKELVENSLDAGAAAVHVELENGGKRRLAVTDDGCGLGRDDALLAFDRHATSKIASFDDLQRVSSLGFRGEALASIAAVARVEATTCADPDEGGWRVRIDGGEVRGVEPVARPRGTTIEVRSLFFNVPARRKFLKTSQTELRRALEVVQGYALARPEVRFEVLHEGRLLLDAPPVAAGRSGARERIRALFGVDLAESLEELPGVERHGERIDGFVGRPGRARGRRLFVFVNGRLLRDRAVLATFYRAVRDVWHCEDFPPLFLFLDVAPEEVDVNVHPQKAEVRFRDPALLDRVAAVLRGGLEAARGEAPAPLSIAQRLPGPLAWEGVGGRGGGGGLAGEVRESAAWRAGAGESGGSAVANAEQLAAPVAFPRQPQPVPLTGRRTQDRSIRLLGQYRGSLLLLESEDALLLVDQHAAHERILYERLQRSFASASPAVQNLLSPHLLELAPDECVTLAALVEELDGHGFRLAAISGGDLAVLGVPAVLPVEEGIALLVSLAGDGGEQTGRVADLGGRLLDAHAASRACKGAIKIHHPLSPDQMESLVSELFACEQPFACPHGRPTVLEMKDAELERRFGRR